MTVSDLWRNREMKQNELLIENIDKLHTMRIFSLI